MIKYKLSNIRSIPNTPQNNTFIRRVIDEKFKYKLGDRSLLVRRTPYIAPLPPPINYTSPSNEWILTTYGVYEEYVSIPDDWGLTILGTHEDYTSSSNEWVFDNYDVMTNYVSILSDWGFTTYGIFEEYTSSSGDWTLTTA